MTSNDSTLLRKYETHIILISSRIATVLQYQAKRLAEKNVSEMTYSVSSGK